MEKILIRNTSGKDLKLTYLLDNLELRTLLGSDDVVIADNHKTPTMIIFENRNFIAIEMADNNKIQQISIEAIENFSKKLEEKRDAIVIIKKELDEIKELDNKLDSIESNDIKMGKWTDEEVKFLKKNYPKHGRNYCVEHLKRTTAAVQSKIDLLKLKKKSKKD